MFPYNDEENAWISENINSETKLSKPSLIYNLLCAILTALFSATLPPLIYFLRTDLF